MGFKIGDNIAVTELHLKKGPQASLFRVSAVEQSVVVPVVFPGSEVWTPEDRSVGQLQLIVSLLSLGLPETLTPNKQRD